MDAADGIFPESVPEDTKKAKSDEIKSYEEERRLFYVGITRAKNNLIIFRSEQSTFTDQLVGKRSNPKENGFSKKRAVINNSDAKALLSSIEIGSLVHHKKYGDGIVKDITGDLIEIEFSNFDSKKFSASILCRTGMLE